MSLRARLAAFAAGLIMTASGAQAAVIFEIQRISDVEGILRASGAIDQVVDPVVDGFGVEGIVANGQARHTILSSDLMLSDDAFGGMVNYHPGALRLNMRGTYAQGDEFSGSLHILLVNTVFRDIGFVGRVFNENDQGATYGQVRIVGPAPVPAPAAGLLLATAFAAFGWLRRPARSA